MKKSLLVYLVTEKVRALTDIGYDVEIRPGRITVSSDEDDAGRDEAYYSDPQQFIGGANTILWFHQKATEGEDDA